MHMNPTQLRRLLGCFLLSVSTVFGQAFYNEDLIEQTLHVNPAHPAASNENDGLDEARPMASIQEAILAAAGTPTRILVYPGTYRELLQVQFGSSLLIIEAEQPGTAVISGADTFADWVQGEDGVYVHSWTVAFGETSSTRVYGLQKRTEMVFVDDQFIPQAANRSEVADTPGSFAVSEELEEMYLHLPEGIQIGEAMVEVTVRGWPTPLMVVNGKENMVLRGLVFERGAGFEQHAAVNITNCDHVAIEDCQFLFNNGVGVNFGGSNDITVRNCQLNDNGQKGMQAAASQRILIVDCEILRNVWRMGGAALMDAWDNAAIKMALWMKDVHVLRCRFADNKAYGIWLDWDQINFRFDDCLFENNRLNGVFFEVSPGPFFLSNCVIRNNGGGIHTYGAKNIRLHNSWVYHNDQRGTSRGEITLSNDQRDPGLRYGDDPYPRNGDWTIYNSVIASSNSGVLFTGHNYTPQSQEDRLLRDPVRTFTENLLADNNIWWHPTITSAFPRPESTSIDLNFTEWQYMTGQDQNSQWANPDLSSVADPRDAQPASPEPAPLKPLMGYRYEAESGSYTSGFTHNASYAYSSGNGALIFGSTTIGDSITWDIHVPVAGSYQLGFRYSLSGNSASEPTILINGEALEDVVLPATTYYGNFDTVYFPVVLPAGSSTVQLEVTVLTRRPVLDFIEIVADAHPLYPLIKEEGGLFESEWLGWISHVADFYWHQGLSWIYLAEATDGVWIYHFESAQWLFTNAGLFPFMYCSTVKDWLWYDGSNAFYYYEAPQWLHLD